LRKERIKRILFGVIEIGVLFCIVLFFGLERKMGLVQLVHLNGLKSQIESLDFSMVIFVSLILFIFWEYFKSMTLREIKVNLVFWIILLLSLILIFSKFIFFKAYYMYSDIGADTVNQYYPYYLYVVQSIRNGSFSVWNWTYGLGSFLLSVGAWNTDPFNVLTVVIGVVFGPETVHYTLVWVQIIKIVVLFALSKKYFGFFFDNIYAINLSAYAVALNGYIMLWGQHYFLGTACIYLMWVLCRIELFLKNGCRKGGVGLAISVTFLLIYSYYMGYMILLFTGGYFLFRYFSMSQMDSVKTVLVDLGHFAVSALSGMLCSCVIFVPSVYYVSTMTNRLNENGGGVLLRMWDSFISSFNASEIANRLSRLMSNNLLYINGGSYSYFRNYYEAPQFFLTIFIFFFFGQWIVYRILRSDFSKRIIPHMIKAILLYLLIFNSLSGLITNGFVYSSYRYSYLTIPIIALCIGEVYQEVLLKKKINLTGILIGAFLSAATWYFSLGRCSDEVKEYVLFVGIMLGFGCLLLLLMYKLHFSPRVYNSVLALFCLLSIVTTVIEGWVTTNDRNVVTREDYSLQWDNGRLANNSATAIDWIKNQDNSFYRIEKTYYDWVKTEDSLIEGYSCLSWYNSTQNSNIMDFYDHIYMNARTNVYAIMYFRLITELDQRAADITNTKYLISDHEIRNDNWTLVHSMEDRLIYENNNTKSVAKWYSKCISKDSFEKMDEVDRAELLKTTVVLEDELNLDTASSAMVSEFQLKKQTVMTGTVDCNGKGILMVAVPDQEGWTVYVDGKKTPHKNCDYGFIGVELNEGVHTIEIKYHIPQFKVGLLLTLIGIVSIVLLAIFEKNKYSLLE